MYLCLAPQKVPKSRRLSPSQSATLASVKPKSSPTENTIFWNMVSHHWVIRFWTFRRKAYVIFNCLELRNPWREVHSVLYKSHERINTWRSSFPARTEHSAIPQWKSQDFETSYCSNKLVEFLSAFFIFEEYLSHKITQKSITIFTENVTPILRHRIQFVLAQCTVISTEIFVLL